MKTLNRKQFIRVLITGTIVYIVNWIAFFLEGTFSVTGGVIQDHVFTLDAIFSAVFTPLQYPRQLVPWLVEDVIDFDPLYSLSEPIAFIFCVAVVYLFYFAVVSLRTKKEKTDGKED